MEFTETALLASIDHTLASVRAALYAAADPEQLQEAQALLAEKAGEDTGRLVRMRTPVNGPAWTRRSSMRSGVRTRVPGRAISGRSSAALLLRAKCSAGHLPDVITRKAKSPAT
jgi:hypothetical protein